MTEFLSAIVLAGGKSSRMGRDKALIPFQGVPLLQRVCNVALSCTNEVYIVTPWPDRYRHIIPNPCCFIPEIPLPGETTPQGPLVGFTQGLEQIQTDWVLLLACDLPRLQSQVLQDWAKELATTGEDIMALVPQHSHRWEPLCGFYRHQSLPLFREFINAGGRSFQRWLAQYPVKSLSIPDTQLLLNCNTPADLED
jgi:molybdopterin-guanine dinucleotide biosynthesis protein A